MVVLPSPLLCAWPASRYPAAMVDNLWQIVETALKAHHRSGRDRAYLFSLNRIFHKYVKRDGLESVPLLSDQTCEITRRIVDRGELARLELYHSIGKPNRQDGPIVVVELEGVRYVVDGNNRLNQWLATNEPVEAEVIVIRPHPPADA